MRWMTRTTGLQPPDYFAAMSLARGRTHHTTKAGGEVANSGCEVKAVGRQQPEALGVIPRSTAEYPVDASGFIQILAPLKHVAAHVVNAMHIGLKTPHRRCRRVSIRVTLDPLLRVVTHLRLWRPIRSPREIHTILPAPLLRRRSVFLRQSYCTAPFLIRGQ